jgi:hypothetical protein
MLEGNDAGYSTGTPDVNEYKNVREMGNTHTRADIKSVTSPPHTSRHEERKGKKKKKKIS